MSILGTSVQKLSANKMKAGNYNVGTLLDAYTRAKGDISFMSVPDVDESVDATMRAGDEGSLAARIQTEGDIASATIDGNVNAQIEQAVADSIRENASNPDTAPKVQIALTEGMTALTNIETRLKADSGNINHQGIGLEAIHDTYMSYAKGGVSTEATALAMAENIRAVMQTQTLTAAEKAQLMEVLTEIVRSAELAEAYVEGAIDGKSGSGYNGTADGEGEYEPDVAIGRSLGAKARNYDILTPNGEVLNLTEGTFISNVEVIAGYGRNREIDMVDYLVDKYGGESFKWRKCKGMGYVDVDGESLLAELHWYEEPSVGRVEFKVKPQQGGELFIYED